MLGHIKEPIAPCTSPIFFAQADYQVCQENITITEADPKALFTKCVVWECIKLESRTYLLTSGFVKLFLAHSPSIAEREVRVKVHV